MIALNTCVVGTRFRGSAAIAALADMRAGDAVRLVREADNPFDPAAVACHYHGLHVGFIARRANTRIAAALDAGFDVTCLVRSPAVVVGETIRVEPGLTVSWEGAR